MIQTQSANIFIRNLRNLRNPLTQQGFAWFRQYVFFTEPTEPHCRPCYDEFRQFRLFRSLAVRRNPLLHKGVPSVPLVPLINDEYLGGEVAYGR